jgi:hypothetical protein
VTGPKIAAAAVSGDKIANDTVTTAKLADGAVTTAKLADNAVALAKLQDGSVAAAKLANTAVVEAKLADGAVSTRTIQDGAVKLAKLRFQQVNTGSASLAPNQTVTQPVQQSVANTQATIYFPSLTRTDTTGAGFSEVDAQIVYRQAAADIDPTILDRFVGRNSTIDVLIRLSNRGSATVSVIWVVNTFAPEQETSHASARDGIAGVGTGPEDTGRDAPAEEGARLPGDGGGQGGRVLGRPRR